MYNALFPVVIRSLLLRKTITIVLGIKTGASGLNRMSSSGDAFLRGRLRCPDDMNYEGYLEFMREFLPLFTLQSQMSDISLDRVFLHRYLDFMSMAITDVAQVAHKESSLPVKSSNSSRFHISTVLLAIGACIQFLSGAKISCRYPRSVLLFTAYAHFPIDM
jgi:hypothetical protein